MDKHERALRKLLKQIDGIEVKLRDGRSVDAGELEKLGRKYAAEQELEKLKDSQQNLSDGSTRISRDSASRSTRVSYLARRSLNIEQDPVGVEDLRPPARNTVVQTSGKTWHVDVRPFGSDFARENQRCLLQIRELSQDCFGSDSAEKCSKKGGWHMTVLTENQGLLGFIVYRITGKCLCIANIAVPVEHRRKGYGKELIRWAQAYARQKSKVNGIEFVGLSSLKESVPFYKAIGFHQVKVARCEDDTLIAGQVYMEYRIRTKKCGKV